ncbi:Stp1/IreP family PP2C-type Ser/Thr phosphatase [Faecalispora anaeroviscerum]|uniref:Stp1/IreP family PP2C-type Ser/Thr phosphatase n=1 Tax=Faecalispora anaeroviscerum TaxID=2991836 RepID=UPI0024B9380F|nr:Stp1/IreP family PP2C-type Ser/Thr phosphatase [Faecalispora anaeroviscerum]
MKLFSKTDVGLVRQSNEDACAGELFAPDRAWAVVCDGMGGAAGGNIASSLAVQKIADTMTTEALNQTDEIHFKELMAQAVGEANTAVYHLAKEQEELRGMGTTVVLVVAKEQRVYIVHAGDSRAYLILSDGTVRQITVDHSIVQELLDKGDLTEQQAQTHPQKNIITRALGVLPVVDVDYMEESFPQGARLLICTDGLSNYVGTQQISQLSTELDAKGFCDQLIASANRAGGGDNITVVVIEN